MISFITLNLKKIVQTNLLMKQVIKGERREANWETGTDIYTLCCA